MIETINDGAPHTLFYNMVIKLRWEMLASDGQSIFGLGADREKC